LRYNISNGTLVLRWVQGISNPIVIVHAFRIDCPIHVRIFPLSSLLAEQALRATTRLGFTCPEPPPGFIDPPSSFVGLAGIDYLILGALQPFRRALAAVHTWVGSHQI
jgi:hypothetical protein